MSGLDFTYEIDAGLKGSFALLPFGGAYLAVVGGNELGGLYLAEKLLGVTADAVVLNLDKLDETFGIADERAAVGHAVLFDHHTKRAGKESGGVSQHRILDFLDCGGGIVPCLVDEVGVGADRVDLHAEFLEFGIFVGHILQLGRTYEGEVCGIEEEDGPLAEYILVGHSLELAVVESLYFELRDAGIDN